MTQAFKNLWFIHSFIKYLFNAYYVQLVFRGLGYSHKQESPCFHEVYVLVGSREKMLTKQKATLIQERYLFICCVTQVFTKE